MKYLSLDFTGWMEAGIGENGLSESELDSIYVMAENSYGDNTERRQSGEIGFWDLPDDRQLVQSIVKFTQELSSEIDTVVVLGIGGSSLGPNALCSALAKPGQGRRVLFSDNSDPQSFLTLLASVSLPNTLFNVVTKSGGTAETIAQLLVVADRIVKELGASALKTHIVATTDPTDGALRRVADEYGLRTFPVPSNVGGRFSALSAVGLLPAALAGVDISGLLTGAEEIRNLVIGNDASPDVRKNPALLLAALLAMHDQKKKRPMVVLMPYSDPLYNCADWFRQLWAESLGKAKTRDGKACNIGPTPIASRGATDQHSQLQLYAEGPDDKTYLFLTLADRGPQLILPKGPFSEAPEFGYLSGHTMGELIDAELLGTRASLSRRGRPNACVTLDENNAECVGAFLMLFEAATAFAGPLYNVDAFDQPGVEEAKRLAYAALGRAGYEELVPQLEAGKTSDARYRF